MISNSLSSNLIRIGRARVPENSTLSYLSHEYWAIHLYFNAGSLNIRECSYNIAPGSLSVTPVDTESIYITAEPLDHIFVHISLAESVLTRSLPIFIPAGSTSEIVSTALISALSVYREEPVWAEIKIIDALFGMARIQLKKNRDVFEHPALSAALTYIDLNLPNLCSLDTLAEHAMVSKTHLNRLFQFSVGRSAMKYVRDKRMEQARYLLVSTILPIKNIAFQVGIPDIHAFNKLCKKYYGKPPSQLRNL